MGKKIILAFIIYSLVVSIALGLVSIFALKTTLQNLIDKDLSQTKIIAHNLDFIIQKDLNRLYDISLSGVIDLKDNVDKEKEALQNVFNYSTLFNEAILLLDKNGNIIYGYPEVYTYIKTINFRNFINEVSYYKKPLITALFYINDGFRKIIFAFIPIKDFSSGFEGVICGIINVEKLPFNDFFRTNDTLLNNKQLDLIDNKGSVIYKNATKTTYEHAININYINELNRNIKIKGAGTFKIRNDHSYICTYASLQYAPWIIVSCQDSSTVFAPIKNLLYFFILITSIYILTGLIFATGLSKGIVAPIKTLIIESKIIAAGDFSRELDISGKYEIEELATSFENMRKKLKLSMESIQTYNEKLESMVVERTKEIEKNKNRIETLLGLIMTSQEEERKRIARELHDEPLQNLSVILMLLNYFNHLSDEAKEEQINKIKELLLKINKDIRLIIQNLRPSVLDDLGLISAIKWVLENHLKPHGIDYHFDYDTSIENMRFSTFIETNVYRIVQEAISNICKHAEAGEVKIKLIEKKNKLIVHISDNGTGFDVNKILTQDVNKRSDLQGIGLLGMFERVSLIGGTLSIDSKENNGTKVTLTVPINGESDA